VTYISRLEQHAATIKPRLDQLLVDLEATPVGHGYIDIIVLRDRWDVFVDSVTGIGIAISHMTLWCHASEANQARYGCPHGLGGPMTKHGWITEMAGDWVFNAEALVPVAEDVDGDGRDRVDRWNAAARDSLRSDLFCNQSPCYLPGFWLKVPEGWRNCMERRRT